MKFLYEDLAPVQQCIQAEEFISGAPLHTGDLKTNEATKEIEVTLTALQKTKLNRHNSKPPTDEQIVWKNTPSFSRGSTKIEHQSLQK